MDRSGGLASRQGSISHMPWPSESSAFTSHLRQCSAESAMERQLGFDRSHPSLSSYFFQLSGQDGRDAIREPQQMVYPNQQQMGNIMTMSPAAATPASRGLASSNWRTIGQEESIFTRAHSRAQPSSSFAMASMEKGDARRATAGIGLVSSTAGGMSDGYAYYLNRGDGQVTRLIPADVLPSLNEIPPRELEQRGMIVLPLPRGMRPSGAADVNYAVTVKAQASPYHTPRRSLEVVQNQIDRIVATNPNLHKRNKVYCDMWIHEGRCAFTQTGCKFKHEMPLDEETQRTLGLFQGLPSWFKKQQEESAMRTARESSSSSCEASPTTASSRSSDFAWQNVALGRIPGTVDSLMAMSQDNNNNNNNNKFDAIRPSQMIDTRPFPFSWGPIARPKGSTPKSSFSGRAFGL